MWVKMQPALSVARAPALPGADFPDSSGSSHTPRHTGTRQRASVYKLAYLDGQRESGASSHPTRGFLSKEGGSSPPLGAHGGVCTLRKDTQLIPEVRAALHGSTCL